MRASLACAATGCMAYAPATRIPLPAPPDAVSSATPCSGEVDVDGWEGDLEGADLDGFCADACARRVTGDVTVAHTPWVDLTPLTCLVEVDGGLALVGNASMTTLAGLDGLTRIGGTFTFWGSPVTSMAGLGALAAVDGDVTVSALDALDTLAGLEALEVVGGTLSLSHLPALRTLEGLDGVERIGGGLHLMDDAALTSLAGLGSLGSAGELFVFDNDALVGLTGLEHLEQVTETVGIHGNRALPALAGLDGLRTIGALYIGASPPVFLHPDNLPGNAALADVTALYGLTEVRGDIAIGDNRLLTDAAIAALLAEIEVIGGDVFVDP